jgi:16S rRNA (uracil1498-N3)-methyltransferase
MADRYFVDEPILAPRATLRGAEAHHLLHVMRAKPGTTVTLFDGLGAEFAARIVEVARDRVEVAIVERRDVNRESKVSITLGVALPKGDRQRWLVEKAVELGVAQLVALETSRSVSKPQGSALERLRRTVIESAKQCGRNRLMEISAADWSTFLNSVPGSAAKYIAHPGAAAMPVTTATPEFTAKPSVPPAAHAASAELEVVAAVGPEGGFTDDEVAQAVSRDWRPLNLGPRVLRVETAALVVAALAGMGHLTLHEKA